MAICKTFGVCDRTVRNSLKNIEKPCDNELRLRIRKAALARGGVVVNNMPECETLHDADGYMRQSFTNGARIEINKSTGDTVVSYKNRVVKRCVSRWIPELVELQRWTSELR